MGLIQGAAYFPGAAHGLPAPLHGQFMRIAQPLQIPDTVLVMGVQLFPDGLPVR